MTRLPRLTGKQLVSRLKQKGFHLVRIRGSHLLLRHSDGRQTVVPVHSGEIIGPGLVAKILKDAKLTRTDVV